MTVGRLRRTLVHAAAAVPIAAGLAAAGAQAPADVHGLPVVGTCAAAAGVHHAAVVVEHLYPPPGHTATVTACVAFTSPTISGEQLLDGSGLQRTVQSYGGIGDAVCQLDGEPQPYTGNCFQGGRYWSVWVSRAGGTWSYATSGVSAETFSDGDAEGFRYESESRSQAPDTTARGVCPPATAASPVTATPPALRRIAPTAPPVVTPHAPSSPIPGVTGIASSAAVPPLTGTADTSPARAVASSAPGHGEAPGAATWVALAAVAVLVVLLGLRAARRLTHPRR